MLMISKEQLEVIGARIINGRTEWKKAHTAGMILSLSLLEAMLMGLPEVHKKHGNVRCGNLHMFLYLLR
jgi:hypothetical protein